ncbi:MAG: Double zinc ribbon [Oscillospiraceae bacterium]|nr:Double zinc ribbon [Oscillospiraceae bacterium]
MLLSQIFENTRILNDSAKTNTDYVLPYLNEITSENIKFVTSFSSNIGLIGYVVFYEDENIYACPKCGHHISNTFSFCPNCAHKMDPSVDEPLQCPACNNNVSYTFDYCPNCGRKLK